MKDEKPYIIIGAGGHAKSVCEALHSSGKKILGCTDKNIAPGSEIYPDVKVLGDDAVLTEHSPDEIYLANGIGSIKDIEPRETRFNALRSEGYSFPPVIHASAIIAQNVELGQGSVALAGSIIQPSVTIGDNVIINTRASIDHDCQIGDHCHIAPGAILCGHISMGNNTHIGAGAIILESRTITSNVFIPAGLTIRHDIKKTGLFNADT